MQQKYFFFFCHKRKKKEQTQRGALRYSIEKYHVVSRKM
jgi:hypothetical protein